MAVQLEQMPIRRRGDIVIVIIGETLTSGDGCESLQGTISILLENGCHRILLDLSALAQIGASGIAQLVVAYARIAEGGGELKLISPGREMRGRLIKARMDQVVDIFEDEDLAVRSFSAAHEE